jgi:hypothetical protein
MAKKVQIEIDVNSDSVKFATDNTLTLTQQVRLLYKELQKVPEGTKEWTTLQKAYNDTKDNLDRVNVKSKELFGTLSTLPGPVGDFSAKLQGGIDLLKTFSGFTLKDLGNSIKGVVSDLANVFANFTSGTKAIEKVTESAAGATSTLSNFSLAATNVATATTNAAVATKAFQGGVIGLTIAEAEAAGVTTTLAAANQGLAVAETEATVAAGALKVGLQILQATGILLIIAALVAGGKALYDFAFSTKGAESATRNLTNAIAEQQRILANDLSAIDQATKVNELRAKLQGKSEKELLKLQINAGQERLALLKDNDEKIFQQQRELNKNTLINAEDRKKLGDDLAAKSLKSNQDVIKQINDNEIASLTLKLKIYTDAKTAGEKASQKEIERLKKELEDKKALFKEDYAAYDGALKARQEATTAFYATEKYDLDQQRAWKDITEDEYTSKVYALSVMKNQDAAKEEQSFLDAKLIFLKGGLDKKLITQREYDDYVIDAQRKFNTATNALTQDGYNNDVKLLEDYSKKRQEYKDKQIEINKQISDSWVTLGQNIATSISSLVSIFEQGSDLQKAFGIVSVLINAAAAIGKINLAAIEAQADMAKTIATGTATVASGIALSSNPFTAIVGAAQIAAGNAAIAVGTAGAAAVKANSLRQTIGVGIVSAAQIAAILSAKKSSGSSVSGGGGGAAIATPAFNGTVNVPAPVIGASQATQSGNLGQTIVGAVEAGNSRNRPIQAYVIGDQVTTQQQLDRRIAVAAKMGG